MLPENLRRDEEDARGYLLALAAGLATEIRGDLREPDAADLLERAEKLARGVEATDVRSFGQWQRAAHAYEAVACAVAGARNARARVARSYESMAELHADAAAQRAGRSPHAVWDTHEHGRRRQLEAALAACHGAEEALLLNSGTSALAVAVGAARLSHGATILLGRGGRAATADYLTRFVAPAGVNVVEVNAGDTRAVLDALRVLTPELALFETAVTTPDGSAPAGVPRWLDAAPRTLFVIDNTAQSALTRWFDGGGAASGERRLVTIESATKHLSHRCTAGLICGPARLVDRMRELARATGQQLQEKAFNFLRPAEITHFGWKLARHAAGARALVEGLAAAPGVEVRTPGSAACDEARASLFRHGAAGIVFVRLHRELPLRGAPPISLRGAPPISLRGALPSSPSGDTAAPPSSDPRGGERAHHALLAAWQAEARRRGAWIPVRAGFGWNDTTAIVHEPSRRCPHGEPPYLRISVGIEPQIVIRSLGRALAAACGAADHPNGPPSVP